MNIQCVGCLEPRRDRRTSGAALLQYAFLAEALGHKVFWLQIWLELHDRLNTSPNDRSAIKTRDFLERFHHYGFGSRCAVLLVDDGSSRDTTFESAEVHGMSKMRIENAIRHADLVWNFCCTFRPPLSLSFQTPRAHRSRSRHGADSGVGPRLFSGRS